ncbi:hypothetical protein BHE90_005321 [Fusarium euwallaceae]|uniref:MARVEL domain-containing protein n=1 Tax=Fusarium euwallaceae TaxID=1147111 RepID=A0A430LWZ4_9HYPO|nr:hypothetical protein BHE90_005321 [Fusarium euwallaceae]
MSGEAGLKCLQWLIRGMQLGSSLLILAVYSYFLATLAAHDFDINTRIRAVEGISGSAALYGILGLLLICCVGGIPIASLIAIILDTGFLVCFIYAAVANKHGAGNCKGEVDTPYGLGLAKSRVKGKRGSLALPTYRVACQLQTACLAAAIIAVVLFFISIIIDVALARGHYAQHRLENKDYGYGERMVFLNRRSDPSPQGTAPDDLPAHTQPDDIDHRLCDSSRSCADEGSEGISDNQGSQYYPDDDSDRTRGSRHPEPPYPI